MKIILIGFATSYKTSVAQILGKDMEISVVDTDSCIELANNQSVSQIFQQKGEQYFRNQEQQLVEQLINRDNVVIACGGGTPLAPNFSKLADSGIVVWLQVGADIVKTRLTNGTRPLFDSLTLQELQHKILSRAPLYQQFARHTVVTDNKSSNQVAQLVKTLVCS